MAHSLDPRLGGTGLASTAAQQKQGMGRKHMKATSFTVGFIGGIMALVGAFLLLTALGTVKFAMGSTGASTTLLMLMQLPFG